MDILRRADRVAYRAYGDGSGGVLLQLDTSLYFGVNQVGALVWELIGSGNDLDGVISGVSAKLDEAPKELTTDVIEFISALADRGLVVRDDRSVAS